MPTIHIASIEVSENYENNRYYMGEFWLDLSVKVKSLKKYMPSGFFNTRHLILFCLKS